MRADSVPGIGGRWRCLKRRDFSHSFGSRWYSLDTVAASVVNVDGTVLLPVPYVVGGGVTRQPESVSPASALGTCRARWELSGSKQFTAVEVGTGVVVSRAAK